MQQLRWGATVLICAAGACAPAVGPTAARPVSPAAKSGEPAAASAARRFDFVPVVVGYRVQRPSSSEALLEGESAVEPGRPIMVERRGTSGGSSLTMRLRALEDGRLLMEMDYDEATDDHGRIRWSPSLVVGRGASAQAHIDFGGGDGRTLSLVVR